MASSEATSTVPVSLLMVKHRGDPGRERSTHLKRCSRLRFLILGRFFQQDEIWNSFAVFVRLIWLQSLTKTRQVGKASCQLQQHDMHPGMLFKQLCILDIHWLFSLQINVYVKKFNRLSAINVVNCVRIWPVFPWYWVIIILMYHGIYMVVLKINTKNTMVSYMSTTHDITMIVKHVVLVSWTFILAS